MASQPPAGYNPEVSLLQGGTGSITPVQGGGGVIAEMYAGNPALQNYNINNSLLNNPSSAVIVAVKGGAEDTMYKDYILERYEPSGSVSQPAELGSIAKQNIIKEYQRLSTPGLNELKRFDVDPVLYKGSIGDSTTPSYRKCPISKKGIQVSFYQNIRRRIVIIDQEDIHIWIIPNLEGNYSQFVRYIQRVPKMKDQPLKFEKNHIVICTGNFFANWQGQVDKSVVQEKKKQNIQLYFEFLRYKNQNIENLYAVNATNTIDNNFIVASCDILATTYNTDYLYKNDISIPTFLEPDILIFKKQHIVFKNIELPVQHINKNVKISEILETDNEGKYKSFVILPSTTDFEELNTNTSDAPALKKYFIFD